MLKSKRGYEFSFAWIFTVILGAVIIFFAVYATTQIIGTKRIEAETLRAKQIGVLLNPSETNLESAKLTTIIVPQETRIIANCSDEMSGSQELSAQIKSGIGKPWTEIPGFASSFRNKYIFSDLATDGEKEFYVLSKPFKFPFKVADLLIIWGDKEDYCFILGNTPDEESIKREIQGLEPKNIEIASSEGECSESAVKVSFKTCSDCDVKVDMSRNRVEHGAKAVFYAESSDRNDRFGPMYAAIFSEPEIYECQIKRLMGRASGLSTLYNEKAKFFFARDGCAGSLIQNSLLSYGNVVDAVSNSRELTSQTVESAVLDLNSKNGNLRCKLF